MLSILVKIIYFIIVSIVSGHYYFARLVTAKGRYVKRQEMLLCVCIFATHLPMVMSMDGVWMAVFGGMQIGVEFLFIVLFIAEKLTRKLMVYVEINLILGIGTITGYGLVMLLNSSNQVIFYAVAMSVAVVLCNLRINFSGKDSKLNNVSGRELTVSLALVLLCTMYVMAVALYDISNEMQILVLYVMFAVITLLSWIILYINEKIQNKEEEDIKYLVYNTIEQNKKYLEEQLAYEEKIYVESYSWLVENLENIYEDMLKTAAGKDENIRVLPINKMLAQKRGVADLHGIVMKCDEINYLPENMSVYDMVSILANLLDNALRAAKSANVKDKRIIVDTDINEKEFYIRVRNTFSENETFLFDEDGNYITTKLDKNGHGLGLKSVKNLVAKYGLMLNINNDDGEFVVTIAG